MSFSVLAFIIVFQFKVKSTSPSPTFNLGAKDGAKHLRSNDGKSCNRPLIEPMDIKDDFSVDDFVFRILHFPSILDAKSPTSPATLHYAESTL